MRWTGGLGGGLSAGAGPHTIARGPDDSMWFTESTNPGGVARATEGVNEFRAGRTPGLEPNAFPHRIALGPDGVMWLTMATNPGRLVRFGFPPAQPTTCTGVVAPGFSANGAPAHLVAGPDGNLWFLQTGDPGRVVRVTPGGAFTALTGGVTPGFSANAFPAGIDAGPDGRLWFTEAAGHRVGRVDPRTLAVTELTGGVTPGLSANLNPQDIVAGPDGAMWMTAGRPRPHRADHDRRQGHRVHRRRDAGADLWRLAHRDRRRTRRQPVVRQDGQPGHGRAHHARRPGDRAPRRRRARLPVNGSPISIAAGYTARCGSPSRPTPATSGTITVGPGAISGAASDIRSSSARLQGFVRPNGQETTYRFEYGRITAYGSRTDAVGADDRLASRAVAQTVGNLEPRTLYHDRIVAVNGSDIPRGADRTFTTGAPGRAGEGDGGASGAGGGGRRRRQRRGRSAPDPAQALAQHLPGLAERPAVGPLHPKRPRPGSTIVSFRLAAKATVRFSALKCLNRRCTRSRSTGGFSKAFKAGTSRFRFTGRVGGKRLAAGRYRLVAAPRGHVPRRVAFRIVRR